MKRKKLSKILNDFYTDTISIEEMLGWRNELAERGFELTPNEVEQYILIIALVLHVTKPDIHKRE